MQLGRVSRVFSLVFRLKIAATRNCNCNVGALARSISIKKWCDRGFKSNRTKELYKKKNNNNNKEI